MKIINNHGIKPYLIPYMEKSMWKPRPDYIRVSELIKSPCMRRLIYEYWEELEVDARKLCMAFIGDGTHLAFKDAISNMRNFEDYAMVWSEQTLEVEVEDIILKGTVDLYCADNNLQFMLDDFKTTKVDALPSAQNDGSWEKQTNVYAYMLESAYGRRVDNIDIVAMIKDWSFPRASYSKLYPQSPMVTIPINKWDKEYAKTFIVNNVKSHKKAFELPLSDLERTAGCPLEYRWHKPDVWACKKPTSSRARACYHSEAEANENLKKGETIEYRYSSDVFCEFFCIASSVCPWKK